MVNDLSQTSAIHIQICDARVSPPIIMECKVKPGAEGVFSVGEALIQAGFASSENDPKLSHKGAFGVFGIRQTWDSPLYEGDRIELYAPLVVDPKQARRKKANQRKDARLQAKARLKAIERASR